MAGRLGCPFASVLAPETHLEVGEASPFNVVSLPTCTAVRGTGDLTNRFWTGLSQYYSLRWTVQLAMPGQKQTDSGRNPLRDPIDNRSHREHRCLPACCLLQLWGITINGPTGHHHKRPYWAYIYETLAMMDLATSIRHLCSCQCCAESWTAAQARQTVHALRSGL